MSFPRNDPRGRHRRPSRRPRRLGRHLSKFLLAIRLAAIPAVLCALIAIAYTQIAGFGGVGNPGYQLNGGATVAGGATRDQDVLTITDGGNSEARSAYDTTLQAYSGGFVAQFTYQNNGTGAGNLADGAAFVLQNDPRGVTALGDLGGALGFASGGTAAVINSVAFEINLYQPNTIGTAFHSDGATGFYTPVTNGLVLDSGDPISVTLSYNPANYTLTQKLVDGSKVATSSYPVILNATLGNNGLAYVGFSGGTGGVTSTQTVTKYTYVDLSLARAPITLQDSFNAANGTSLNGHVPDFGSAWFVSVDSTPGALQINNGVVNTTGAARVASTGFGLALSANEQLLVTLREQQLGNFFGFLAGWDLLVGDQTVLFFGSPQGTTTWTVSQDNHGTGALTSTSTLQGVDVALDYDYNTGDTELYVNEQVVASGVMPADLAIDGFGFENNNGGDVAFGDVQAAIITPAPEPSSLCLLGAGGVLWLRRRSGVGK
jgi:Legume lectin domain/PEP-CTERM motif